MTPTERAVIRWFAAIVAWERGNSVKSCAGLIRADRELKRIARRLLAAKRKKAGKR